jgi:hypothetical protein
VFKIEVRSVDASLCRKREATAERILAYFEGRLPDLKLLCFLDDVDWDSLKDIAGKANRGLFTRTKKSTRLWPEWQLWPDYLKESICVIDFESFRPKYAFDCLLYLHGSTCATDAGLTMTFAHELQHFCQYGNQRRLWALNTLLKHLPVQANVNAWDIPFEQEARIVSKRAAECLCGKETVQGYIAAKVTGAIGKTDADDWKFVQQLATSSAYDLFAETALAIRRFEQPRPKLQDMLTQLQDNVDFRGLDLDEFF